MKDFNDIPSARVVVKDLLTRLDKLEKYNIDFHQRKIYNATDGVDDFDYVTMRQLRGLSLEKPAIVGTDPVAVVKSKFDKATFGLVKPLIIETNLTNFYICRRAGTFVDLAIKLQSAPDNSTNGLLSTLVLQLSKDDGVSWLHLTTITLNGLPIILMGKELLDIKKIAEKDLLRINCTQIALPNPGQYIEIVLRWE